ILPGNRLATLLRLNNASLVEKSSTFTTVTSACLTASSRSLLLVAPAAITGAYFSWVRFQTLVAEALFRNDLTTEEPMRPAPRTQVSCFIVFLRGGWPL